MIALAELHKLIHSMNKPEKRFFKLMCATETLKISQAVNLFDIIEKTGDNDDVYYITDQDERADLSAVNLDLLYQLILKSQRSFYSETIEHFSINDELSNLKILFEKAQHRQCRKMIRSLKERSAASEKFNYLIEITELEKELLKSETNHPEFSKQHQELSLAQDHYIEQEKTLGMCYQLYASLKFHIKHNPLHQGKTPDSYYEAFLNRPELKETGGKLPKKARMLLMACKALCYTALKRQKQRCSQLIDLKNFVAENEFLVEEMSLHYIDVLYNLASVYLELNEPEKVQELLKEMNALLHSKRLVSKDLLLKLQSYAYNVHFLLYTYTAKYREAMGLAGQINDFIRENGRMLNREDKSVLLYNLINFYIYNRNFNLAETTLDALLGESDKKGRWDLKCYARLQQMVLYYEQKQYARLPLVIDILRNLVKEKVFTAPTELTAIQFFEDILKETEQQKIADAEENKFKHFYNELKPLMKNKEDRWSNFFYFNFYAWAASKTGGGEIKDLIHKDFKHAAV